MDLTEQIKRHWQDIRGRTYDLLDLLTEADLDRKLPFAMSESIGNQFYCMLGSQESWGPLLLQGRMEGWACTLSEVVGQEDVSYLTEIEARMRVADNALFTAFDQVDWSQTFDDGTMPLAQYLRLVEHEAHHHGQLINFIFACDLPIPESWADTWGLSR